MSDFSLRFCMVLIFCSGVLYSDKETFFFVSREGAPVRELPFLVNFMLL